MRVEDDKQHVLVVTSVRNTERKDGTYNLTVADFHTYFVGELNVLVHNCKKLKAKERRAQEKQRSQDAKGGDMQARGTPRGNQRQNKQFKAATKGLSKEQKRDVHEEITGQNKPYNEIKDIAEDKKK